MDKFQLVELLPYRFASVDLVAVFEAFHLQNSRAINVYSGFYVRILAETWCQSMEGLAIIQQLIIYRYQGHCAVGLN